MTLHASNGEGCSIEGGRIGDYEEVVTDFLFGLGIIQVATSVRTTLSN
jgi:hypothetical protein